MPSRLEPYSYGLGLWEDCEGSLDPEEYQPLYSDMDWIPLQILACSLPLPWLRRRGASFAVVVRRAAEILDLSLPSVAVKTKVLTEVLQPE